jgi:hypothetical protein
MNIRGTIIYKSAQIFAYANINIVGQLQRAVKEAFISLKEAVIHANNKNRLQA